MIEVKNLKKSFDGNTILQNVNFTVNDGDSVVIIGGSGCGKSTLLRCLNHLIVPDEGEILFNGKNILESGTNIDEYRQHIGMVYQHFNLFEHLNVMENMILAPMKVLHMEQEEAIAKAEKILARVGMQQRKYQMPSQLSGGQKQRVAIARTLMMEPDMILFDEPTSALDPTMVDEVEDVIKDLIANGMTSVIVTHEMGFARRVSNRTIFLAEKGIYEEGPTKEFFKNPGRELTRQFIYRSRLFVRALDVDTLNYFNLLSEVRRFLKDYGVTMNQWFAFQAIIDEVVAPMIDWYPCSLQVLAGDSTMGHKITVTFPTADMAPADMRVDDIGIKLLQHYAKDISNYKNAEGHWEVTATI